MNNKKVVLVVGAGDATGGAIARRFAEEGYVACVTRRSADNSSRWSTASAPKAAKPTGSPVMHAKKTT